MEEKSNRGSDSESPFIGSYRPDSGTSSLAPVTLHSFPLERAIGLLLLMILGICAVAVAVVPITEHVSATGRLDPIAGQSVLPSRISGVVDEVLPIGSIVEEGQTLAVISAPDQKWRVPGGEVEKRENIERRIDALGERTTNLLDILAIRRAELESQRASAQTRLGSLRREISLRRRQLEEHEKQRAKLDGLAARKYISVLQMAQFEDREIELRAAIESIARASADAEGAVESLSLELSKVNEEVKLADSSSDRERLELDHELNQILSESRFILVSPEPGRISRRIVRPGQYVRSGDPIVSVSSRDELLVARLSVPSNSTAKLELGNRAFVFIEALEAIGSPYLEGEVIEISRIATPPETDSGVGQWHFEVVVRLVPTTTRLEDQYLRAGMALRAEIVTGERTLWRRLFTRS